MAELSRDEVVEVLGSVGDVIVAEIIATGIGKDELVRAYDRVVKDRKAHDPGPPLEPGRFARVVDILERSRARGGDTLERGLQVLHRERAPDEGRERVLERRGSRNRSVGRRGGSVRGGGQDGWRTVRPS